MAKQNRRKAAAQSIPLNDDFRRVVAERLLDGADPDLLATQLASSAGIALGLVQAEIRAGAEKPPVCWARASCRTGSANGNGCCRISARLAANDPEGLEIPVLDKPDPEAFPRSLSGASPGGAARA